MYTGYDCIQWFMKVRDHCHVTKKYNDSTHNECNTNFQDSFVISAVLHIHVSSVLITFWHQLLLGKQYII